MIGGDASSGGSGSVDRIVIGRNATGTANDRITLGIASNLAELDLNGSDTSWAASSDERLKENINDSEAGLSFLNDLRVRTFDWRKKKDISPELENYYEDSDEKVHGEENHTYHGFIAQEVQEVLTNHTEVKNGLGLIKNRDDGVLAAAPSSLVPVLVKAIQELSAKVEELESKLNGE